MNRLTPEETALFVAAVQPPTPRMSGPVLLDMRIVRAAEQVKAAAGAARDAEEVLVEGSWFTRGELPRVLGTFIRASEEHAREAKDLRERLDAAEATIRSLREGRS